VDDLRALRADWDVRGRARRDAPHGVSRTCFCSIRSSTSRSSAANSASRRRTCIAASRRPSRPTYFPLRKGSATGCGGQWRCWPLMPSRNEPAVGRGHRLGRACLESPIHESLRPRC
jgi:hypothetical protein